MLGKSSLLGSGTREIEAIRRMSMSKFGERGESM